MENREHQQSSLPDEIMQYYEMGREAQRLAGAQGELEFVRTKEIISRHLPEPPAVVLDIGGGPGAYACWLAQAGYEVHLIDAIPLHLEQARQASLQQPRSPIKTIKLGDARKLGFPNDYADVVLLLGPLYHLTERSDRLSALREAYRVLKPGGVVLAVGISRFASTFAGLIDGYFEDADFIQIARKDVLEGQHRNPTAKAHYFTTAFFHHPDELGQEIQEAGFAVEAVLAVEGAAVFLQDLEQQWSDPERRNLILEAVRWLEGDPSVIGVTGHLVAIGTKS